MIITCSSVVISLDDNYPSLYYNIFNDSFWEWCLLMFVIGFFCCLVNVFSFCEKVSILQHKNWDYQALKMIYTVMKSFSWVKLHRLVNSQQRLRDRSAELTLSLKLTRRSFTAVFGQVVLRPVVVWTALCLTRLLHIELY